MGYRIQLRNSSFTIKKKHIPATIKAIKDLKDGGPYSWVSMGEFTNTNLLERHGNSKIKERVFGFFEAWRWPVETNDKGDIVGIEFEGEKLGDENIFFTAIAPYVENHS